MSRQRPTRNSSCASNKPHELHTWRPLLTTPLTSARAKRDEELCTQVRVIHQASRRTYGSPRVHAELHARGERCGRKRVARLMRQEGLRVKARRRCRPTTTDSKHTHRGTHIGEGRYDETESVIQKLLTEESKTAAMNFDAGGENHSVIAMAR